MQHLFAAFLVLLPLLFVPWANQQFELPKFVLVLVFAGISCMWMGYAVLRNRHETVPLRGVTLAGSVLLVYLAVHTFFLSFIPDNSIWGSYQRHTGLLLYVALAVIFITTVRQSLTAARQEYILRILALAGTAVALAGVIQWLVPDLWGGIAATNGRIFGTMGVPNFLGQLVLMSIVLTVYQVQKSKGYLSLSWAGALLLQLFALVATGNRASLLVCGGLAVLAAVTTVVRMRSPRKKSAVGAILVMLLLVVGYGIATRSDGMWRSLESRAVLYPTATSAWLEQPVFGFGLDTLYTVFSARLPINLGESENLLNIPDKAHQLLLDTLVETGVVGAILWLWVITAILWLGWSLLKKGESWERIQSATILIALIAWGLTLLVSFPGIVERVFAVVLLGVLVAQNGETIAQQLGLWRRRGYAFFMIFPGVLFLLLATGTLVADIRFARISESPVENPMADIVWLTPMHMEYEIFGNSVLMNREQRGVYLESALAKNPQDAWAWTFLSEVRQGNQDAAGAENALQNGRKACPKCSFVYMQGARLATVREDTVTAKKWAEGYVALLPSFLLVDPAMLSPDALERRRITIKEQKADLQFMLGLLDTSQLPYIRGELN